MPCFTRRLLTSSFIGATLILVAGCGGDSTSTSEPDGTNSSAATATNASSADQGATSAPDEGFDGAVAEAFRAGMVLAELRMACFDATDLSCFISTEQSVAAAEREVAAALELVASASVEAGADPDRCQAPVATVVKKNSSEWSSLLARAQLDGQGTRRFGEVDWEHHRNKLGSEISTPGHAVAGVLLGCINAVNDPSSELMFWMRAFVESSDRARTAFSYNLLTQFLCIDQAPDPSFPGQSCFDMLGSPDEVGFGRGKLEGAHQNLTSESRYSELPQECRNAIDEANTRLMSSLDIYNNVSDRDLVSSDPELQGLLSLGVFQIDDQRRGTAPMFPFDEKTALTCAAAAAGIA